MRFTHSKARMAFGIAALLLVAAAVAPTASAERKTAIAVTIDSATSGTVHVQQVRTESDAAEFRQSLDVLFGDADGTLTEDEVARIATATQDDLQNKTLPLVRMDGGETRITDARVALANAEGPVDSPAAIGLEHNLTTSFGGDVDAERHTLTLEPPSGGIVTLDFPDDWTVAETQNLSNVQTNEAGTLGGTIEANSTAVVVFSTTAEEAGADGGEESDGDASDAWAALHNVPGPAIALTGAAVLAGALVMVGRRRTRR